MNFLEDRYIFAKFMPSVIAIQVLELYCNTCCSNAFPFVTLDFIHVMQVRKFRVDLHFHHFSINHSFTNKNESSDKK
jgi:hypothetical protein